MSAEKDYWLAFSHIKGVGAVRFRKLISYFGSLEQAWQASEARLLTAGLSEKVVAQISSGRKTITPEGLRAELERKKINFLTWEDPEYPEYLRQIDQPPPVIYFIGEITAADGNAAAIVGTRAATTYGRQLTKDVAAFLAGNGVTVVSGLARGVDAIAHQAALDIGGRTIAVLGSGVDVIYPPEHRQLAEHISHSGAVLSDYPPGTKPDGINFPPRNRIISGLSRVTIVIEAGEKSGALITAKFAVEQGREVFAVPGSVLSAMSKGTNNLLAEGATPLTNPADVLKIFQMNARPVNTAQTAAQPDPEAKRILSLLGTDSMHIDELCQRLDISIDKLTAQLALMELEGLVQRTHGMEYQAVKSWDAGRI